MKIWAKVILAGIIVGFITWGCNAIYDAGADSQELVCTKEKKEQADDYIRQLNDVRDREQKANEAADNIARTFHGTIITEVEKNAELRHELSKKPAIEECIKNDAGINIAYISDDTIGMLNACSQTTTLPASTEKQGFVTENKVTTADLSEYLCEVISQYNRCAIEVNGAIDEQNTVNGELP